MREPDYSLIETLANDFIASDDFRSKYLHIPATTKAMQTIAVEIESYLTAIDPELLEGVRIEVGSDGMGNVSVWVIPDPNKRRFYVN